MLPDRVQGASALFFLASALFFLASAAFFLPVRVFGQPVRCFFSQCGKRWFRVEKRLPLDFLLGAGLLTAPAA